jgi:hypothetical protein
MAIHRAPRPTAITVLCLSAGVAHADVTVWKQDEKYLDVSMLIQIQGRLVRSEGAGTTPDGEVIFFRRLRPAVSGSIVRDWYGIIEMDLGAGFEGQDPKTTVQSAYLEYTGFQDNQQTALKIGSIQPAFGREFLTSGSKLLTVDATFNGNHWYGTPDLTMGLGLTNVTCDRKVSSRIVAGMMSLRQRPDRIWFQSPQNQTDNTDDTGALVSGRIDYWPLGEMPTETDHPAQLAYDPSDRDRTHSWHLLASAGGYGWWNNNDNNQPITACPATNTNVCPNGVADVDRTYGGELSGTVLGYGLALTVEYQHIRSKLRDRSFDGGLYRSGETDLDKLGLGGGYMVYADKLELFGHWSLLSATNFPSTSYSTRLGLHWFVHEHALQFSADATRNTNAFGTSGAHENIARVQAQLAW